MCWVYLLHVQKYNFEYLLLSNITDSYLSRVSCHVIKDQMTYRVLFLATSYLQSSRSTVSVWLVLLFLSVTFLKLKCVAIETNQRIEICSSILP